MTKKKGKAVSFDAMVKFFMQYYDLPTKTDLDKIGDRIDRLESLVREMVSCSGTGSRAADQGSGRKAARSRAVPTAADTVYSALKTFKGGADLADLQAKTGFGEKKLRNIIFRLHKLGRIQRQSRGVYRVKSG